MPVPSPALVSSHRALTALRVVAALLLVLHGLARIVLGIVDDFGVFLSATGFPLGTLLAWAITLTELAGGALLAARQWTRPLALYFAAQLVMGIVLVHAREGWFVVGAGRNGMEYSVLLIAVLLAVAYAAAPAPRPQDNATRDHAPGAGTSGSGVPERPTPM